MSNKKRNIMDIINKAVFVEEEIEEVVEKKDNKSLAEKKIEERKAELKNREPKKTWNFIGSPRLTCQNNMETAQEAAICNI